MSVMSVEGTHFLLCVENSQAYLKKRSHVPYGLQMRPKYGDCISTSFGEWNYDFPAVDHLEEG